MKATATIDPRNGLLVEVETPGAFVYGPGVARPAKVHLKVEPYAERVSIGASGTWPPGGVVQGIPLTSMDALATAWLAWRKTTTGIDVQAQAAAEITTVPKRYTRAEAEAVLDAAADRSKNGGAK